MPCCSDCDRACDRCEMCQTQVIQAPVDRFVYGVIRALVIVVPHVETKDGITNPSRAR